MSRKLVRPMLVRACAVAALLAAASCPAAALVSASSPYFSTANSTLNPLSPTYLLEDFEDGLLNTGGITQTSVIGSLVQGGLSVDGDDGLIDESGALGKHFAGATAGGTQSTTFFFQQIAGQWPKQVAIAVTGGSASFLSFAAYDLASNPSGSLVIPTVNVSSNTADDFLVTFIDNAGISAIAMTSNSAQTFIHYDHLQLDTALATIAPEPTSLLAVAPIALAAVARRRRH